MIITNKVDAKKMANANIAIGVQVERGNFAEVEEYFPKATITNMLSFPEIILPGESRNDFYIQIFKGTFQQEGKKSAKNLELTITLHDREGKQLDDCLSLGSFDDKSSVYKSVIFYHNNNPVWNDVIKISVPQEVLAYSHLKFVARHTTTRDKKGKIAFSIGFMHLGNGDGTVISNDPLEVSFLKPPKGKKKIKK